MERYEWFMHSKYVQYVGLFGKLFSADDMCGIKQVPYHSKKCLNFCLNQRRILREGETFHK